MRVRDMLPPDEELDRLAPHQQQALISMAQLFVSDGPEAHPDTMVGLHEDELENLRARALQAMEADAPLMTLQPQELLLALARGDIMRVLLGRYVSEPMEG